MRLPERLVLATNNPKKLAELRRILVSEGVGVEVLGLGDVGRYPEPAETERTFEGNAFLKAAAAARETGLMAVADDSGLEVDELNGMPGVRSARWAGPACDDEDNNQLLLAQLDGVPTERRTARFVCALAGRAKDQMVDGPFRSELSRFRSTATRREGLVAGIAGRPIHAAGPVTVIVSEVWVSSATVAVPHTSRW